MENAKNQDSWYEGINKINIKYGPFGEEKVRILENSFDMFLENIISGPGVKQEFYSIDKDMPRTFSENQSFLKMKKYQQYEKYPDEIVREYIISKAGWVETKNEFNNDLENRMLMIRFLKEDMIEGIEKLFEGKEIIYKCLRKYDNLSLMKEGRKFDKESWLEFIRNMKVSNFSYKDVFGIETIHKEVEESIAVPNPKILKKLRVNTYGMEPSSNHPNVLKGKFKVRELVLAS